MSAEAIQPRERGDAAGELRVPGPAIGLIGAATLLLEILLTRIFSVTMWYHFAFVAISLALFGIAASGAAVTAAPGIFRAARALAQMEAAAWAMGASVIVSFAIDLQIPFVPFDAPDSGALPYLLFGAKFLVLSLPFFFGGLIVALAFTHAPRQVHRVYFADLAGGGVGCALAVPLLLAFSGPTAVVAVAVLPLLAAAFFHRAAGAGRPMAALAAAAAVALVVAGNAATDVFRITRVKSYQRDLGQTLEGPLLYERWHPVSRVAVHPLTQQYDYTLWFYSPEKLRRDGIELPRLHPVTNDAGARTYLFPGAWRDRLPAIFRRDLTDLVFHLTGDPDVLVVGVGGGKDVLSALALGARHVTGVELNPLMIEVTQERFAEFTGAPYDDPRVEIAVAEGRNYIARSPRRYDVIKISATDTWTASAMGAYALTESYLYTLEAMREFLAHLEPGGFLSVIRWYPHETLRLAALAAAAIGGEQPHLQIAMARSAQTANLMLKNGAFTGAELAALRRAVREAGLIWIGGGAEMAAAEPPVGASSHELDRLHRLAARRVDLAEIGARVPFSIAPPTDDRPFFFNPVSIRGAARGEHGAFTSFTFQHGRALSLLWGLLQVSLAVAALFVLAPLLVPGRLRGVGDLPTNLYFLMLGFGYLLVEIPILQRLILFLGHPTYAVTVVLFSLLVSSALGSLLAERLPRRAAAWLFPALLLGLVAATLALPAALSGWIGLPLAARVLVAVAAIVPLGLLLGMPFPLGVRELHRSAPQRVPWAWAVNGAASVGAPVLAMIVGISFGFSAALALGAACYAVAALALIGLRRPADRAEPLPAAGRPASDP